MYKYWINADSIRSMLKKVELVDTKLVKENGVYTFSHYLKACHEISNLFWKVHSQCIIGYSDRSFMYNENNVYSLTLSFSTLRSQGCQ